MKDYLYTGDFDLQIVNGDFAAGESTEKHQKDLIVQDKGDDRIYPFIGVGISTFINDDNLAEVKQTIRKHFELDGMTIERLVVYEDGTTDIKANYE